jgi:hypothetical protein
VRRRSRSVVDAPVLVADEIVELTQRTGGGETLF